jgi:hypothetical protein
MKTSTTAIAALILGLAAGPAFAACVIPDKAVHAFNGKPVAEVQAAFARAHPECTLVLNGEVSGAHGFWKKPPQAADYHWPSGTMVATVETGREDASGNTDPLPRIFIMLPVACEEGQEACAIPLARQWPGPAQR